MKACYVLFFAAMSLLGGQPAGAADAEAAWKIEKLTLTAVRLGVNSLNASVVRASESERVELSYYVKSEKIRDAFVWQERLVLLGDAVNPSVVEVFDLALNSKVDWFYCYQPRRIGDNWIAYKEFYFGSAQGPGVPAETLLVYDLAKTPQENRLKKQPGQRFPPPLDDNSDNTVEVGFPVYPEVNARQRSYQIVRETTNSGLFIDAQSLALLPSKKLIFSSVEMQPDMGWLGALQYLVVVDLSRGLEKPQSQVVYFPKQGEYGTTIERIEADAEGSVRLVFPAGEYSVKDLVVTLPVF